MVLSSSSEAESSESSASKLLCLAEDLMGVRMGLLRLMLYECGYPKAISGFLISQLSNILSLRCSEANYTQAPDTMFGSKQLVGTWP